MFDNPNEYYSRRYHTYRCEICGYKWEINSHLYEEEEKKPSILTEGEEDFIVEDEELAVIEEEPLICPMCGNFSVVEL